jgi:ribokinase
MPADRVLLFGDINVDNIFQLAEFPEPGRDGYAKRAEMHLGGTVCNSAGAILRLGQPIRLLGAVGDDLWSKFVFAELNQAQIDTRYVVVKPDTQTGLIFIAVTPNGERTMLSYRGANIAIQPEDLPQDVLDGVCLVQFSGYVFLEAPQRDTAWKLIEMAVDQRIPISMDTGLDPVILAPEVISAVLPYLSVLITGKAEAEQFTRSEDHQAQLNWFLSLGLRQVAIKLGHEGAWMGWEDGILHSPAFPVKVVDTTSAGDAFSSGLIYGYLHGFTPAGCLLLANALGGLATTVYGAARFGREDVAEFLHSMRLIKDSGHDQAALEEVLQRMEETS